jgi:pimeloyl-ACP methyl ester carboxylesterase
MLRLTLMPVRHHALSTPDGRSTALISNSPTTDTAIIFVHGFQGHCSKSWQSFQVLIDLYPESYGDSDLYFFDYDAENNHLGASSEALDVFLRSVYPDPPSALFRYSMSELDWADKEMLETESKDIRTGPWTYRKLQLVGHSLGGVVIRHLIAEQARRWAQQTDSSLQAPGVPSILSARVFLFAPAHLGVAPSGAPAVGIAVL